MKKINVFLFDIDDCLYGALDQLKVLLFKKALERYDQAADDYTDMIEMLSELSDRAAAKDFFIKKTDNCFKKITYDRLECLINSVYEEWDKQAEINGPMNATLLTEQISILCEWIIQSHPELLENILIKAHECDQCIVGYFTHRETIEVENNNMIDNRLPSGTLLLKIIKAYIDAKKDPSKKLEVQANHFLPTDISTKKNNFLKFNGSKAAFNPGQAHKKIWENLIHLFKHKVSENLYDDFILEDHKILYLFAQAHYIASQYKEEDEIHIYVYEDHQSYLDSIALCFNGGGEVDTNNKEYLPSNVTIDLMEYSYKENHSHVEKVNNLYASIQGAGKKNSNWLAMYYRMDDCCTKFRNSWWTFIVWNQVFNETLDKPKIFDVNEEHAFGPYLDHLDALINSSIKKLVDLPMRSKISAYSSLFDDAMLSEEKCESNKLKTKTI